MPLHCALRRRLTAAALLLSSLTLAGCGGSSAPAQPAQLAQFTVSGTVSGLASGASVVLTDNASSSLPVTGNGAFTFSSPVSANASYDVTVATQPTGEVCTVANGTGAGVTANVTNVAVVCSAETLDLSGSVSGLASGAQVVLENGGADALTVSTNGPFTFKTPIAYGGSYAVTVATQPSGATCTVSNATGAGVTANVTNVAVTCAAETFTVGGTLSGLAAGTQVTLDDNGGDPLTVTANGAFTFHTPVAYQGSYAVTVGTQPVGQVCTVTGGSGAQVTTNISNVSVTCSTATFTIGGTLTGLAAGAQVTLDDNGADASTLTADGTFQFATPVAYGTSYAVTVATQPGGQVCFVSSGSGSAVAADVTAVAVTCMNNAVSFTTPGSATWTVPAGTTSVQIVATGGGGGGSGMWGTHAGAPGGAGASVTSTLAVHGGEVLDLVIGGGGGAGASGPGSSTTYTCGGSGGGGGSTMVDVGASDQIIAGGGGGGGSCSGETAGASGGTGANGAGGSSSGAYPGVGGSGGTGGVDPPGMSSGGSGGSGNGGAGGSGSASSGGAYPGGSGGWSTGTGVGGTDGLSMLGGGGGGGYGGGASGGVASGGGAGGSVGPAGTTYAAGSNGGGSATAGGGGSVVITIQP
jgi:hypothetical protein